ncbi:MAG: AI-2E family transporter, partial [Oscillospiraceae bacterium]|nr:AI-2E family transporter [Oscillospiraceae bacterium]
MDRKTVKTILFTAFLAAAVIAVAVKPEFFIGIISRTLKLLMPVFFGLAFAFVMNMPVCSLKKFISRKFGRLGEQSQLILAVAAAYIMLLALLTGIFWIIIPQLTESVKLFISNADHYYNNFLGYCTALESRDSFGLFSALKNAVTGLGERIPKLLERTYYKTSDIIGGAADVLIGFVISIYIILDKKKIRCGVTIISKKLAGERYESLCKGYRLVFSTFCRFVSGQITEAVILG